jgi:hypothetical protein
MPHGLNGLTVPEHPASRVSRADAEKLLALAKLSATAQTADELVKEMMKLR